MIFMKNNLIFCQKSLPKITMDNTKLPSLMMNKTALTAMTLGTSFMKNGSIKITPHIKKEIAKRTYPIIFIVLELRRIIFFIEVMFFK
jgi:hypothetical protein